MRPPRFRRWAVVLAAMAALLLLMGWRWQAADAARAQDVEAARGVAATGTGGGPLGTTPFGAPGPLTDPQRLVLWQQRYLRAEEAYTTYKAATRYPPDSRPIGEHPDQVRPFAPIAEEVPLRDADGKPAQGLAIRTTQDKVFLAGPETAHFTIEAVDANGRAVPITIERAAAQSMPDTKALITLVRADVPFNDAGAAPDAAPNDGRFSGQLTPAAQGFGNHAGTIRLLVDVSAGDQKGVVPFDVVYTPEVPAVWAGARDALENGSLSFYLKAKVAIPGRYVATARVYDANGVPFALLQFNDTVAAGAAEFRLVLAGALVRDKNPAFPLRLVDVEGFLLRPDTFPDRAMMPRQAGEAYVSRRYELASFSDAEWSGEERSRYLAEYGRDMQRALDEMARLRQK